MLKYRADRSEQNSDGSVCWYSEPWHMLSKIENCRTNMSGDPRVTAFVQGEADTFFSVPAVCSYRGCRVTGYITSDDDGLMFRHCYY
jgi:hypothetical protein